MWQEAQMTTTDSYLNGYWRIKQHDHDNKDPDNEHPQSTTRAEELRAAYNLIGLACWLRRYRICLQWRRPGFNPWIGKIPWRREWQHTLEMNFQSIGWRLRARGIYFFFVFKERLQHFSYA